MNRLPLTLILFLALLGCQQQPDAHPPVQERHIEFEQVPAPPEPARFYMSVFAYQTDPNLARNSHTFASFIRVQGKNFETHTISWFPRDDRIRILHKAGQPGKNMNLTETLHHARDNHASVFQFGPYPISESLYKKALFQVGRLESGVVRYSALGHSQNVCNCIHAVSNVVGPLKTGTTWGVDASRQIVVFFRPWIFDLNPDPEIAKRLALPETVQTLPAPAARRLQVLLQ